MSKKRIAILGSTGSIGCNALEVIAHLGDPYRVAALSANRQIDKLIEQARKSNPTSIAVADEDAKRAVAAQLPSVAIYVGPQGLAEMVRRDDIDIVLAAIVGAAGLPPVLSAVQAGKNIALANKESLVVAGSI